MIHDEKSSNTSGNRPFADVLEVNLSRRTALFGGLASAVSGFLAVPAALAATGSGADLARNAPQAGPLLGFTPVPPLSSGPLPAVSADYEMQVLLSWGDNLYPGQPVQSYDGDPTRRPTAAEQAQLIGIGHDGMTFFPMRGARNARGLLAINLEFGDNTHLLGKPQPTSLEDVRLSQHAHGVAIVELARSFNRWTTVASPYARRIHVNTPVAFSGPAAGHALLQTKAGNAPAGTLNNCANGQTPWGTYLTCEENFNGYFGVMSGESFTPTPEQARYGFSANGFGYGWQEYDPRFDLGLEDFKNEENRFGWVVEIDPMDPASPPVKRTALGRLKHEGAEVVVGRGGRVVCYMGDDEVFDYVYKFVSAGNWKSMRAMGKSPLDEGRLYVAKFNDDGTGAWLELTIDNPVLAARFADQAEILVYARIAADLLGATPMDRPEWISVGPDGEVYCTLTNNSGRAVPNAPNPVAPNPDGHIIKWRDTDQFTGTSFTWDIFLLAKDTRGTDAVFTDPDGLWCDPDGRLFIQTDGGQPSDANGARLNNQMVVADTRTGELRRLFQGVAGDEITGVAVTPNRRYMFINTQHPGEGNPALTSFPAAPGSGYVPRDSTIVIWRKDGGIVGS